MTIQDQTIGWGLACAAMLLLLDDRAQAQTLDEPFHMPTMTDASTLDVVVVDDWHVDTVNGTTRQKLIHIHVDEWWPGVEIRVPVRLIVPLEGSVDGFIITGSAVPETGDSSLPPAKQMVLDGGVGVVQTKIKSLGYYPTLPSSAAVRDRYIQNDLDFRYSEVWLWSAIMMRSITAAFDDDLFRPGPVIAHGNSKNGITPLVSSIHDERITAVRSTHAFTVASPIRRHDPAAVAEVAAADSDFDAARSAGLPQGDQPWNYYYKAYRSTAALRDLALAAGWSEAEIQASFDRVADDVYVSENWDELAARGVDILSLPGSHDWVAYDVPSTSVALPDLRTYIVPNGGHSRPGHPEAPSNDVDAAFFAEQLFGADGGLETPDIATAINGGHLDVTVTFPSGGVPEDSRIFWMYDRGPDGSSWYLYRLFPHDNWAVMDGAGDTWTCSIPLESGRDSIDLITTHTVTVGGNVIPISAPYTRVSLSGGTATYCDTTLNSAGSSAVISSSGSASLDANDWVLRVTGSVPNSMGLFYYGGAPAQAPFGDGIRCVAAGTGGLHRILPASPADALGDVVRPVDFSAPPMAGGSGAIAVGDTWFFQYWYRDVPAGGSGFNLSNGLAVIFGP